MESRHRERGKERRSFLKKRTKKLLLFTRAGETARGPDSQTFVASPGGQNFFQKRSACFLRLLHA
jgi:hypothetical protein